jgi:biotin synthase
MCYAIPGKVIEISGNIITVEYFGEKKKARNEFMQVAVGDYVFAQGGFVINKVDPEDAKETLKTWEELFFQLKEIDLRLSRPGPELCVTANNLRQRHLGNSCCVHGIIEISNHCDNNCLYCGIRKGNTKVTRYRMTPDEIVSSAEHAINVLGFKALVLQSGEDASYSDDDLADVIKRIKAKCGVLLFASFGERNKAAYQKFYDAGARGALVRFETSNPELYAKMRPGRKLSDRLDLIRGLYDLGYLVITGSLVGLPGQTEADILEDIRLTKDLKADMFSFGPLIPHPDTPLGSAQKPVIDLVLTTIARARIMDPEAKIVVTTALETLNKEEGARQGLMCGGNSVMINVTPMRYRKLYDIYPDRAWVDDSEEAQIKRVLALLKSLGRAPTDLGV